jgi:hypothetical protein
MWSISLYCVNPRISQLTILHPYWLPSILYIHTYIKKKSLDTNEVIRYGVRGEPTSGWVVKACSMLGAYLGA